MKTRKTDIKVSIEENFEFSVEYYRTEEEYQKGIVYKIPIEIKEIIFKKDSASIKLVRKKDFPFEATEEHEKDFQDLLKDTEDLEEFLHYFYFKSLDFLKSE